MGWSSATIALSHDTINYIVIVYNATKELEGEVASRFQFLHIL